MKLPQLLPLPFSPVIDQLYTLPQDISRASKLVIIPTIIREMAVVPACQFRPSCRAFKPQNRSSSCTFGA